MIYQNLYNVFINDINKSIYDALRKTFDSNRFNFLKSSLTDEESINFFTKFDFASLVDELKNEKYLSKLMIKIFSEDVESYEEHVSTYSYDLDLSFKESLLTVLVSLMNAEQIVVSFLEELRWLDKDFLEDFPHKYDDKYFVKDKFEKIIGNVEPLLILLEILPLKHLNKIFYGAEFYKENGKLVDKTALKVYKKIMQRRYNFFQAVQENISYADYVKQINKEKEINFRRELLNKVISVYFIREVWLWFLILIEILRNSGNTKNPKILNMIFSKFLDFNLYQGNDFPYFDARRVFKSFWEDMTSEKKNYVKNLDNIQEILKPDFYSHAFYPVILGYLIKTLMDLRQFVYLAYEPAYVSIAFKFALYTYVSKYFYRYINYILSYPKLGEHLKNFLKQNNVPLFLFNDLRETLFYLSKNSSWNVLINFLYTPPNIINLDIHNKLIFRLEKVFYKLSHFTSLRDFSFRVKELLKNTKKKIRGVFV